MRRLNMIIALLSLLVPAMTKAQYAICDTIRTERIVVKSAQFGISLQNNLDTYLSNYNYKGGGIHFNHESFRDARTGNYRWKYQVLFNSRIGYALQQNNIQLAGIIGCSWSGYHPFSIGKRLKLLAGAQIQLEGGALYCLSNGNNPVSAKLRTAVAASGMAGMDTPNTIQTRKIMKRFYLCGDGVSDVADDIGLIASRVMLCAAHQAQMVLRILSGNYEP